MVRDPQAHKDVVNDIIRFVLDNGLKVKGLDYSPIKGPEGNIEYLIYISKTDGCDDLSILQDTAHQVVDKSHI